MKKDDYISKSDLKKLIGERIIEINESMNMYTFIHSSERLIELKQLLKNLEL